MAGNANSGRKAVQVTERARFLVEKHKLLDLMAELAASTAVKTADRIQAGKLVLAYAHGQPAQKMDLTSAGKPLLVLGTP